MNNRNNISGFLVTLSDEEEKLFGFNHWRSVLKRALSEDKNFLNYLETL